LAGGEDLVSTSREHCFVEMLSRTFVRNIWLVNSLILFSKQNKENNFFIFSNKKKKHFVNLK